MFGVEMVCVILGVAPVNLKNTPHFPHRIGRILAANHDTNCHLRLLGETHREGAEGNLAHDYQDHPLSEHMTEGACDKPKTWKGREGGAEFPASTLPDQAEQAKNSHTSPVTHKTIPIRLLSDEPDSIVFARYESWSGAPARPTCIGDGKTALRTYSDGARKRVACMGAGQCEFAKMNSCSIQMKMPVQIDHPVFTDHNLQGDVVEVRSSNYATYKTILGQLRFFKGKGLKLSAMRLVIDSWVTSNEGSQFEPIACMRLRWLDAAKNVEPSQQYEGVTGAENAYWQRLADMWDAYIYDSAEYERHTSQQKISLGQTHASNQEYGFSIQMPLVVSPLLETR